MAIVAEFSIPPEAVPGGATLTEMSDVRIELERIVPASGGVFPFFWMFGGDPEIFLTEFQTEPDIKEIHLLADVDHAALFSATWTPDDDVIQGIQTLRAAIMQATGTADEWHFQVRAPDREHLLDFQRLFEDQGIPVQLDRIYDFSEMLETDRPLTDAQRETLLVAYEKGYFDQPRQVTQAEIGEHFGISSQAVATRLQRGIRNLVRKMLATPTTEENGLY
jgi:predicted DNA binding protein